MTNIESLKKYVGNVTEEEFMILAKKNLYDNRFYL